MRARAPESARTNVHLTEQYGRPCFSFSIYKVGIRSHNCGTMSMEHLAQCLAMRNPEHRKVISSGHSSGSFHIPIRKAAEPRCARMTFGFRLGTLPAKPGPSWNLLGQDLLQTLGLGRWDTPNLRSTGRKLSNGRIPDPGTGLPWGLWGRSHTELSKSWERSRRQRAWWGMAGFRHSPHTYHLYMVLLGILKQVSARFQRRSELEAQAAQRVGVLGGNAQNHPEGGRQGAAPRRVLPLHQPRLL